MGPITNAATLSYDTLSKTLGINRAAVSKGMRLLKHDNWIKAVRTGNGKALKEAAREWSTEP